MPTSEARIAANRQNALKSTGPKTAEGKARSRANAFKHGLTGDGVVLVEEDAAQVDQLEQELRDELKPSGEEGRTLVRQIALMSVRLDRSALLEAAAIRENIRRAEAEFDANWPEVEGEADPDRAELRAEAAEVALFDPSRKAELARKYEAAAERSFYKALKDLRQVEKEARAPRVAAPSLKLANASLGSFLYGASANPATPPATSGSRQPADHGRLREPERSLESAGSHFPDPRNNLVLTQSARTRA